MKEQICKIHRQPFMVVCIYCAREARKAEAEGKNLPERFRDIANAE